MAGLVAAPFDPIYAPTSMPWSAWPARWVRSTSADGIRIHALCPSFAYTNIIKGSEQTLLDMGFPIIEVADVVGGLPAHPRLGHDRASAGTSWPAGRASRSSSGVRRGRGSTED